KNIYVFDYSQLYRNILIESNNSVAIALGIRLENAPSELLFHSFFSNCIYNEQLEKKLTEHLQLFNDIIISIEPFLIKTTKKIPTTWAKYVNKIDHYVHLSKYNNISIIKNKITFNGLQKPNCKLFENFLKCYILNIQNIDNISNYITKEKHNIENFVIKEKLSNIDN